MDGVFACRGGFIANAVESMNTEADAYKSEAFMSAEVNKSCIIYILSFNIYIYFRI